MQFPLTEQLIAEAREFALRSSCRHCVFFVPSRQQCAHEWPDEGQARWPLSALMPDGSPPATASFCKEFELA